MDEIAMGISMGKVPKGTQTFPNELKFSELVKCFVIIIFTIEIFFYH